MEIRIKDTYVQSMRMFNSGGNCPRAEQDMDRNDIKMRKLFLDLKEGKIKAFSLVSDTHFRCYHNSTKQDGYIQYSFGAYEEGVLIPHGDIQMKDVDDFFREGYKAGVYIAA